VTVQDLSDGVKHAGDAIAGVTIIATLLQWMPAIAAVLAVIWTAMRIFESYQSIVLNGRKLRRDDLENKE
jgi:hypothetical protein